MIPKLSSKAMFWWGAGAVVASIVFGIVSPSLLYQAQLAGSSTLDYLYATLPTLNRLLFGLGVGFITGAFVVRHLEPRAPARTDILLSETGPGARRQPLPPSSPGA